MKREVIKGVEVWHGSDNIFADLKLPDAGKLKVKAGLISEIASAITALGLSEAQAAERMGLAQPKVSNMLRGDFASLSERMLMDCVNRLGSDSKIAG